MLPDHLSSGRRILLGAACVAVALLLLTAHWRSGREQGLVDGMVMLVADPLLRGTTYLAGFIGGGSDFLLGYNRLRRENRELREEVARLKRELETRNEEHLAYGRLAEALRFRKETGLAMTVASVIGHDSTNLFRTILINKGARDGVVKNAAVLNVDGVVGKTIQVYPGTARVLLLTDRSSGIPALVRRTRDQGVLLGTGQGGCEMKYLPAQAEIVAGDTIVTSGMAGIFPKGMKVGMVTSVRRGGYLLRKVEIEPSASLERLEEVMVLDATPGGVEQ